MGRRMRMICIYSGYSAYIFRDSVLGFVYSLPSLIKALVFVKLQCINCDDYLKMI